MFLIINYKLLKYNNLLLIFVTFGAVFSILEVFTSSLFFSTISSLSKPISPISSLYLIIISCYLFFQEKLKKNQVLYYTFKFIIVLISIISLINFIDILFHIYTNFDFIINRNSTFNDLKISSTISIY